MEGLKVSVDNSMTASTWPSTLTISSYAPWIRMSMTTCQKIWIA